MGGYEIRIESADRNFLPLTKILDDERKGLRLSPEGFQALAEKFPHLIPDQARERIEDKSKGDVLAKTLVCIQGRKEDILWQSYLPFSDQCHSYMVLCPVSRSIGPTSWNQPSRVKYTRACTLRVSNLLPVVE